MLADPYRIGLVVNPIAGLGAVVGLKGSDGPLAEQARGLGAEPRAGDRALRALQQLGMRSGEVELLTAGGPMGEDAGRAAGFVPRVVHAVAPVAGGCAASTAADTRAAAAAIAAAGADLMLFAGGDGTARDVLEAIGGSLPTLGIPAGVKMHSAVFATSARAAGDAAREFLASREREALLRDGEVMDRDPALDDARPGSPRLYGTLRVPALMRLVQRAKATPAIGDEVELEAACHRAAALCRDGVATVLGPGSTMLRIKQLIGVDGTRLGVDVVRGSALLARDAGERDILAAIGAGPARAIVSVVGGQGFLFGRGNQQLSASVLRRIGCDGLIIVASQEKLAMLPAGALLVDTGDEAVDAQFSGYLLVITGGARQAVCRAIAA